MRLACVIVTGVKVVQVAARVTSESSHGDEIGHCDLFDGEQFGEVNQDNGLPGCKAISQRTNWSSFRSTGAVRIWSHVRHSACGGAASGSSWAQS